MTPLPEADRLVFRRFQTSDQADVRAMFADDYAAQFYPTYQDQAAALRWIDWNLDNYREYGFGLWAICDQSGAFVGDCGLTWQNTDRGRQLELGYHVTQNHRGHGYAIEAGRAVLAWGWDNTDAPDIVSIVAPENMASIRSATRLHQGCRSYTKADGSRRLLFYTTRPGLLED